MAAFVRRLAMILIFIIILDKHHYALPTKSDEAIRQTDLEENELVTEPVTVQPNTTQLQSEKERKRLLNRVRHLKMELAFETEARTEMKSQITRIDGLIRKFEVELAKNRQNPEIDEKYHAMVKYLRKNKSHLHPHLRERVKHVQALTNELQAVEQEIKDKHMEKHSNKHHKKVKGKFLSIPKETSTVILVGHQALDTSTLAASKSTVNNHLARDEYATTDEITTISDVVTSTSNETATKFKDATTISNEATDNTTTTNDISTNAAVEHNTTNMPLYRTTPKLVLFDIFKALLDEMRNKTASMNSKSHQPPEKIVGKTNHQIVLVKFPAEESENPAHSKWDQLFSSVSTTESYQQPNHMVLTKNEEFQYDEDESEA